jgi:uncharacterized spore protein YtfJ
MSRLIQSSPSAGKAIAQIEAAMTVRRIFGEPIENDGIKVLPVARVAGGAGGGAGDGKSRGWGGGFGVISEPLGVFVIDGVGARRVPVARRNLLFSAVAQPTEFLRELLFNAAATRARATTQTAPTKATVPKKRPGRRVPRGGEHPLAQTRLRSWHPPKDGSSATSFDGRQRRSRRVRLNQEVHDMSAIEPAAPAGYQLEPTAAQVVSPGRSVQVMRHHPLALFFLIAQPAVRVHARTATGRIRIVRATASGA